MAAKLYTIAAGCSFADALVRGIVHRYGIEDDPIALSRVTLYVPTRRAVRTMSDAFTRVLGGAVLLPDIVALGDVDDDELLFASGPDDLDLPAEIDPIRQRLLLTVLVKHWDEIQRHGELTFAQAASLARGLAGFLAEIHTQNADLARLEELVPASLAQHWAEVKAFLGLLRDEWPKILADEACMDAAARRNLAIASLIEQITSRPSDDPIVAAGSTGSIPATAALLRAIAHAPNGAVILPDLDLELDDESWSRLDPGHPQFGMKQLLARIDAERPDVAQWSADGTAIERRLLLRETMRPAPTTDAWRALAAQRHEEIKTGLAGLSTVEAAHPGEEATAIALMLREVLETPGKTATLVTPDRNLARRVAAELGRWGVEIDDSAGQPLAHTPCGAFLCLLADAADARFAPVPLLSLLDHPFASAGEEPAQFRARLRVLNRLCLRGPRPDAGLESIEKMIERTERDSRDDDVRQTLKEIGLWFRRIVACLAPLASVMDAQSADLAELVRAHVASAEALSATHAAKGAQRLWQGPAGESAASLIARLSKAALELPPIETSSYPVLFRAFAEEGAVRPAFGRHPRLSILGPLEARLQSFDLVILGSLNEDSWPRSAATDPWLSRPMREKLGLEQPERAIGLAAHDFATLAATPHVVLTRALKSEGSPTVPSRWWQRLIQLTRGLGLEASLAATRNYTDLARHADEPQHREPPLKRPAPRPPVDKRPRSLSVTEIETWLRDPYAIYAKHVLRLSPLDPLDAEIGPLERGTAVHAALEHFLKRFPQTLPPDAETRLIEIADKIFHDMELSRATRALWFPRFMRAAHWFVPEERERRAQIAQSHVELRGTCSFKGPAGAFELRARADRIDVLQNGGAAIIDYKTGNPPTKSQVEALLAPQLPLEGTILKAGGFPDLGAIVPSELVYIRFGGGAEPGELRSIPGDIAALVKAAEEKLLERIAEFDSAHVPYVPRVMPFRADQPGDYDHLARVREWSLSGWKGGEE